MIKLYDVKRKRIAKRNVIKTYEQNINFPFRLTSFGIQYKSPCYNFLINIFELQWWSENIGTTMKNGVVPVATSNVKLFLTLLVLGFLGLCNTGGGGTQCNFAVCLTT